ncbi:hypothetical protein [Winogradskyella pulchriflava]|uniref:Uncharacterized protein n=1 Tax=Winogradskyella pulchriflava TaxID=1110688 RepID=A0ABV6Q8A4_9FLAO
MQNKSIIIPIKKRTASFIYPDLIFVLPRMTDIPMSIPRELINMNNTKTQSGIIKGVRI